MCLSLGLEIRTGARKYLNTASETSPRSDHQGSLSLPNTDQRCLMVRTTASEDIYRNIPTIYTTPVPVSSQLQSSMDVAREITSSAPS